MRDIESKAGKPFVLDKDVSPEGLVDALSDKFPYDPSKKELCIFLVNSDSDEIVPFIQLHGEDYSDYREQLSEEDFHLIFGGPVTPLAISMERRKFKDGTDLTVVDKGPGPIYSYQHGLNFFRYSNGNTSMRFTYQGDNRVIPEIRLQTVHHGDTNFMGRFTQQHTNRDVSIMYDYFGDDPSNLKFRGIVGNSDHPQPSYLTEEQARILVDTDKVPDWANFSGCIRQHFMGGYFQGIERPIPELKFNGRRGDSVYPQHNVAVFVDNDVPEIIMDDQERVSGVAYDHDTNAPYRIDLTVGALISTPFKYNNGMGEATLLTGVIEVSDGINTDTFQLQDYQINSNPRYLRENAPTLLAYAFSSTRKD
jgi:hypothetical protein